MSNPFRPRRFIPRPPPTPTAETQIPSPLPRPASSIHPGRLRRRRLLQVLGLVLALSSSPASLVAQAGPEPPIPCGQGRISHVFVDNHSIFDVDDLAGMGSFRWAYELANALHVRTRESFIRDELLFGAGDCYEPFLLEETGRILRSYPFIARADIYAVDQLDGTKHVVVDTQDEWTTQVDLGLSVDAGLHLETLEATEKNFLGRGILLEGFLRQRRERKDLGAMVEFPRLFGTRLDASVAGGSTRAGNFFSQSVRYPFVGEVGRVAMRQAYSRRDEIFPYAAGAGRGFSHLALPYQDERVEVSMAGRIGVPGNLTLFGLGMTRSTLEYAGYPGDVELIPDNDFGAGEPAPAELRALLKGQARPSSTTRLNFLLGQRNLRFVRVGGLDPLAGEQDLRLGTDLGLTVGRSVDVLTASDTPTTDDLFGRLRVFAGAAPGTSYVFANLGLQGRQIFSDELGEEGWRDVLAEADLYGYIRSRRLPDHTFFARVSGAGGWRMATPFQLTLGGRSSVRGYEEEDYPGARRVLATLEDRIFLHWPLPDLFDLGLTVFADAGRVWPGEIPFGSASGWRGSVGGGLRFGFPAGSRGVARLDVAFPLSDDRGGGPMFRVTLYELHGLAAGFFDPQMERSRRVNIGPDSFVSERR